MQKKWVLLPENIEATEQLANDLKVNRIICSLLGQRAINSYDTAKAFFRPQLTNLHSPWLMKDMRKAVIRIEQALEKKEKILIFGDYDVDGTTSVACVYQFLKKLHPYTDYYIPHRYKEGYGVSKAGIDYAHSNNFTLIITLDCGIKSIELIAYGKSLGIDVIVCDHHQPDNTLPDAVAILNPKQKDCTYPYKELCGCGVGFKLMTALAETFGLADEAYLQYIDLVATAIAADIVPITGENRILAFWGVEKVNSNPCIGIKALLQVAGINQKMNISDVVFTIAPRINAAGRMDDAKKSVQLFIENELETALHIAKLLHNDNTDRKEADTNITEEALAELYNNTNEKNKKSTVIYKEHWHKGVVGIVASRLTEYFYRPTIVLTKSGDIVSGSARSVPGFNVYEALHACKQHLLGYGGHFAAAGLTLDPENVTAFAAAFEQAVEATITDELLTPHILIDCEIALHQITTSLYNLLMQMEPFGPENMRPVFVSRAVHNNGYSKIVKDKHIKFNIQQHNTIISGIGFNLAKKFEIVNQNQPFDIVYTLDMNEYNGNSTLQLRVIDIQASQP